MSRTNRLEVPAAWAPLLAGELGKPYFQELVDFLEKERGAGPVYPPPELVFNALALTPPDRVRVLILGQDPYHGAGQAQGLAFSVPEGVPPPPSLVNVFREMAADLGVAMPRSGNLVPWARQGVLLLNAVLTVRAGQPNSHKLRGWEHFTDAVIRALNDRDRPLVFVLWGSYAKKKAGLIDTRRHRVLLGTHPSPLSARQGFFGSRPFSKIDQLLLELGQEPIDWALAGAGAGTARANPAGSGSSRRTRAGGSPAPRRERRPRAKGPAAQRH